MSPQIGGISGVGMDLYQSTGSNAAMDQADFLKLLMIQLAYQDPMNPVDSQQFSAQLAQFSQLEQLTQMNENLQMSQSTNMILAQSVNNTMAASMIGRSVTAYGDQVELVDGAETMLNYNLGGAAQTVEITIKNEAGAVIRTIEAGPQSSGEQQFTWDGLDDEGNAMTDGVYTFSVSAKTGAGLAVQSTTYTCGTITGVTYTQGMPEFLVGSMQIALGDVYKILEV
ncbi:MAG: flagellar hook assembly protein FlgD [bacterium]|nr:flagellar hook assembly protein FlgD [bacterium]